VRPASLLRRKDRRKDQNVAIRPCSYSCIAATDVIGLVMDAIRNICIHRHPTLMRRIGDAERSLVRHAFPCRSDGDQPGYVAASHGCGDLYASSELKMSTASSHEPSG
jgi:hypothetical protein